MTGIYEMRMQPSTVSTKKAWLAAIIVMGASVSTSATAGLHKSFYVQAGMSGGYAAATGYTQPTDYLSFTQVGIGAGFGWVDSMAAYYSASTMGIILMNVDNVPYAVQVTDEFECIAIAGSAGHYAVPVGGSLYQFDSSDGCSGGAPIC